MKSFNELVVALSLGCFVFTVGAFSQASNTISGHVFGENRQPLEGITVELLDDFQRGRGRVRTNSGGRYFFGRGMVPNGSATYRVKISPFGTNYMEQEARVEIQNFTDFDSNGAPRTRGFMNAQRDFYLRLDPRNKVSGPAETVFAQDVPTVAKALYEEGKTLLSNKKRAEGYNKLKSAIETFPDYYLAIERLGLEYYLAKHYRASSILLQRAVQIHPRSYKGWYVLGRAFESLDLKKDALEAARKASTLSPSSVDALLLTGSLLRRTSSFRDSEKHLTKAKKLSKTSNPDIHWELALLYGKNLKRYKEAADELEVWLKLRPESVHAASIKSLIQTYRAKSRDT